MSALAALDAMVPAMILRARTWDTDRLRALYAEGLELSQSEGPTATLWEETMIAVGTVLRERATAEAEAAA